MNNYYFTYETDFGLGTIIYNRHGIKYHFLPESEAESLTRVGNRATVKRIDVSLKESLESYFRGREIAWSVNLDLSGYSDFARDVYRAVMDINYGRRLSYKQVAIIVGRPSGQRAVGTVLKRNRLPLFIPCHRVIAAGGALGGWSGPPGWKERLLEIESRVE